MTEQDVRRIIREELAKFSFSDRFFIYKNMQFADGVSIQAGLTNGLKVGMAITQKLSVYGVTPVVQAGAISAPTTQGVSYVQADVQSIVTAINSIRTALTNIGITA